MASACNLLVCRQGSRQCVGSLAEPLKGPESRKSAGVTSSCVPHTYTSLSYGMCLTIGGTGVFDVGVEGSNLFAEKGGCNPKQQGEGGLKISTIITITITINLVITIIIHYYSCYYYTGLSTTKSTDRFGFPSALAGHAQLPSLIKARDLLLQ